jgi:hypothetical protein
MAKIKRSSVKTFILTDDTPSNEVYSLLGEGVTTGTINMNPKTTEETYIHEDTASISVDSYAPTMPVEMTAVQGDAVFSFIDGLRKDRAVLGDAETYIVNVWLYEAAVGGAYPAEKQKVSIQVDTFGGDGGAPTKINYTLNYVGDAVVGTFNPSTLVFTPDA